MVVVMRVEVGEQVSEQVGEQAGDDGREAGGRPDVAVFCDFDGTITSSETFANMLKQFAPELAPVLMPKIWALEVSLSVGVRQMVEAIPSSRVPEIVAFARASAIRAGLPELIGSLAARGVPFYVVSGGFGLMIRETLRELLPQVAGVYACEVDASGPNLKVVTAWEDGDELVAKVKVIEHVGARRSVAIGDSTTDLKMALHADVVFARDRLARYLDERSRAYIGWGDFHDVERELFARGVVAR